MADKFGQYWDSKEGAIRARYAEQTELGAPYFAVMHAALNYVWSAGAWIPMTPSAGGGGGGMTDAEFAAHLPLPIAEPVSVDDNGGSLTVDGTFWQATQPISAATLPLPTGAATDTTVAAIRDRLPAALVGGRLDVSIGASPATVPVSGTFWQATQPVSGTFWQATQPVSGTITTNQGTTPWNVGGSNGAYLQQTAGPNNLLKVEVWSAAAQLIGQQTMAGSLPVVIASNQTGVPVTGTFWQVTQPISAATLPLPTGAATEATLLNVSGATGATAAAVPARAIYNGVIAKLAMPTATTDGQLTGTLGDQYGRVVTAPAPESLWGQGRVTLTTVTSTAVLAAAGAGVKWAISSISVTVTTGVVATRLDILDGATLIHSFAFVQTAITAGEPRTYSHVFPIPYKGTANTAVNAQLSIAVTDCRVVITGFKTIL